LREVLAGKDLMTRPEFSHFCAPIPNTIADRTYNRVFALKNRFRFFAFVGLIPLCLIFCASSAVASSKNKRSRTKPETRTRRNAEKPRVATKASASKGNVASKRPVVDNKNSRLRLASQQDRKRTRDRVIVREIPKTRETEPRRTTVPNVRQTVMISPKIENDRTDSRPTLVNDIVIISEAREIPTVDRLSPMTRGGNLPSIWPVAGAIRGGFGVRRNPFGGWGSEFHKGQDISAPYGAQVIATADGMIERAGWLRGYGQVVYVDHGNGISTRYGHLSRIDVTAGQMIKRGDQLGLVGSTGRSTGPHLHYEVRVDGQAINPVPYLPSIPAPINTAPATR
jgi:murein DD-endopeptidase MepM/ murein hydrolase activator NlpD